MANKNEYLTDEEIREINFLKKIKESLCKNCQATIDERIISLVLY